MKTLIYSLIIVVALIFGLALAYPEGNTWYATTFGVIFFSPCIVMIVAFFVAPGFSSSGGSGGGDYMKMQNFYNLDAMRRNSDQEARRNQPWQNKK